MEKGIEHFFVWLSASIAATGGKAMGAPFQMTPTCRPA